MYRNIGNNHLGSNGMGFYPKIQETYGFEGASLLKKWSLLQLNYAKIFNQRIFLLRCRKLEVLPKHLQVLRSHSITFNSSSIENRFSNLQFAFQRSILNLEIRDTCVQIKELENFIFFLTNRITSIFPTRVFNRFFQFESSKISLHFEENKFKCKKKLDSLINSLKCNKNTVSNSKLSQKWFRNLTGVQIPENVAKAASLGKKFGVTIQKREIPTYNIIADIESNINKINRKSHDILRLKITNVVNNFKKNGSKHKSE